MRPLSALLIVAAAAAGLATGCSRQAATPSAGPETEKASASAKQEPFKVEHGTNGEAVVHVAAAWQRVLGLEVAALASATLSPEMKGFGRVLDASPLASLVAELAMAQAATQASQAELKRLKILAEQNNTSERALQAAEAAAVRDQAQLESVRLRLLTGWGPAIAGRGDLPTFVQSLGSQESALVALEVPAGEAHSGQPTAARLVTLEASNTIPAQLLGPTPAVDPQMQGRGFLLLVQPNDARLTAGRAVTGFLSLEGPRRSGVILPRAAVVRFNGFAWVYRQTAEESFERVQVALDTPLNNGWFVAETLKPSDKVVIIGGQVLLSTEANNGGEE